MFGPPEKLTVTYLFADLPPYVQVEPIDVSVDETVENVPWSVPEEL